MCQRIEDYHLDDKEMFIITQTYNKMVVNNENIDKLDLIKLAYRMKALTLEKAAHDLMTKVFEM